MARKTIASLEEEIKVLNRQINEISKANTRLINEKAKLIEAEDNTFENSCLYAQMKKEIDWLNLRVKTKEGILETRNKKIDKQASLIQELLTENENLKKENEELKAEIVEFKDKLSNIQLENTLLKGLNETLKVSKQVDEQIGEQVGEHNRNIGADEELKKKLNRAIERNKAIISDYAKCSKENEQLKNMLKKKHNERGAGRKKKIDDNTINKILSLRNEGLSIRAIAKEVSLSVGSIQNVLKGVKN